MLRVVSIDSAGNALGLEFGCLNPKSDLMFAPHTITLTRGPLTRGASAHMIEHDTMGVRVSMESLISESAGVLNPSTLPKTFTSPHEG